LIWRDPISRKQKEVDCKDKHQVKIWKSFAASENIDEVDINRFSETIEGNIKILLKKV
jgi:hypothetical protein